MKLFKHKGKGKYELKFEISPEEATRVELYLTWHSSDINDYIDALQQIQKISRTEQPEAFPFEYYYQQARKAASSAGGFTPNPNQQYYAGFNPTPRKHTPEPAWVKVLGLKRTATKDEIRSKYRELAKKNHPDKGGDALEFAAITAAYDEAMK